MTTNPEMASLKTLCLMFDWKYDTMYKKYKAGEFVTGYKQGKMLRFRVDEVREWATARPVEKPRLELLREVI